MSQRDAVCRGCSNTGTDLRGEPCLCRLPPVWAGHVASLRQELDLARREAERARREAADLAEGVRRECLRIVSEQLDRARGAAVRHIEAIEPEGAE